MEVRVILFVVLFCLSTKYGEAETELIFSSEFDGPADSSPGAQWTYDIGSENQGWGNFEHQYYTNERAQSKLDGKGNLLIIATKDGASQRQCWYGTCKYLSARIKTQKIFEQTYGRFEARIKVPEGKGLWPAFWLLGANIDTVKWPACGEIGVMEIRGSELLVNTATAHGPGYEGVKGISATYHSDRSYSQDFHVFAVDWAPNKLTWSVDGKTFHTVTPDKLPAGAPWVFDHPFFIILNLAVGGLFPGDPAPDLSFPQTLTVDYVRVYKHV